MALTASPPLPSPSSTLPTTRAAGLSSSSPSRPHYFELYPPGSHLPRLPAHPKKPKAGPSSRRKVGRLNSKEGQRIKRETSPMREKKDGTKGERMSKPTSNETSSASEPSRSKHPLARTPSLRSSPDQPSLPRPSRTRPPPHLCSSTQTLDSSPSVSYPKRSSSLQPNSLPLPLASSQRRPLIQSASEHDPPLSYTSSEPVMLSLPVSISSSSIDNMINRMPNQLEEPWLDASSLGPPPHSASLRSSFSSSDLSSLASSSSTVPRPPPSIPLRRLTSETLPSFPSLPPLRLEPASSASSPRPIIRSINDMISNNINKEASRERTHPLLSAFSPPLNQSTFPAPQQVLNSSIVQSTSSTVAHAANLSSLSDLTRTTPSTSRTSIASFSLSSTTSPSHRPALDLDPSLLLQSPRLNHLITLPNHDNLTVSFADVGCSSGIPVVLFLGLGGVRFLAELFSELACTMGIRLICVDRWGLGKTDDVGTEKRGVLKWASVLTGVMDAMGIKKFGVLAHSAGAPYALATATCFPERILGSVHLLAPWTGIDADGGTSIACPPPFLPLVRYIKADRAWRLTNLENRVEMVKDRASLDHQDQPGRRVATSGLVARCQRSQTSSVLPPSLLSNFSPTVLRSAHRFLPLIPRSLFVQSRSSFDR
jgi:pimeloyl-ACP methyl ester carboxylesterase